MILFADIESYSTVPLTRGVHRYAEEAEVLLFAWAFDDQPVQVWDLTTGEHSLAGVQALIDMADTTCWHNSAFDRTVLRHLGVNIPVEKIEDTMVRALAHSLPASLGMLCDVLGVPQDKAKDKAGKKLIQLFTKPLAKNRKLRRATRDTHPAEWAAFIEYARLDVDAMRDVRGRIPSWNDSASERELWLLDQDINDHGIAVDVELARSALRAFDGASRTLAAAAGNLTGGLVSSATQRDKVLEYLAAKGVEMPDLTKGAVNAVLKDDDIDDEARELLENRLQAAATSPAKYKVILNSVSADGRLRGLIQFCGASRTGRDAGRLFQPQNLPRPTMPAARIELGIRAMKAGIEEHLFDNVSELCASAVRGCLVAPEGTKLVVADLSNIEGRGLAWLAGEEWKIQAFRDFDKGVGHDLYALSYARSFRITPEEVIANKKTGDGSMRQIGKVQELSLGYQGGVGAYVTMGANYGVDPVALSAIVKANVDPATWEATKERYDPRWAAGLDPETWTGIKIIVDAWRAAHPSVVNLWYDIDRAAKAAIRNPGERFEVRGLQFDIARHGCDWLRIRLPSGRYLSYPRPSVGETCPTCRGDGHLLEGGFAEDNIPTARRVICPECYGDGVLNGNQIFYDGVNQYTRKWARLETYGGKFVENITQAVARDVFMGGLRRAMKGGYPVVLRVHDELGCEVPDTLDFTAEGLSALMTAGETWTAGLPLAAAGHEMYRYAKLD